MAVDYSELDHFCKKPHWSSFHGHDLRRLDESLSYLLHVPGFHPDDATTYVRQHHTPDPWGMDDEKLERALKRLNDLIFDRWRDSGYPRRP